MQIVRTDLSGYYFLSIIGQLMYGLKEKSIQELQFQGQWQSQK